MTICDTVICHLIFYRPAVIQRPYMRTRLGDFIGFVEGDPTRPEKVVGLGSLVYRVAMKLV